MNNTDEVSAGSAHTCARRGTTTMCWGHDYAGEVNATFSNVDTPVTVNINGDPPPAKHVVVGYDVSSVIGTDDIVTVWGSMFHGDGQGDTGYAPAKLGLGKVLEIDPGKYSTVCAIKADRQLVCWGLDTYGQVGNGDPVADVETPAAVEFKD
jgi:alpha-tubulin suppressor-like RCC1 family protein